MMNLEKSLTIIIINLIALYQNTINQEIQIGTVSFEDNKIEIARGVCNYLANNNPETSDYTIGWHPNFEQLLSEVENDDERD